MHSPGNRLRVPPGREKRSRGVDDSDEGDEGDDRKVAQLGFHPG